MKSASSPLVFRPEEFFAGRATGWGQVFDLTGRPVERYSIETRGTWAAAYDSLHMDEAYTFEDGRVDRLSWALNVDDKGRYSGLEPNLKAEAKGFIGLDGVYRLRFVRPADSKLGRAQMGFSSLMTRTCPRTALVTTRISRLGMPIATMKHAYLRQG